MLQPILKCSVSTQTSGMPPSASSTTSVVKSSAHRNGPKETYPAFSIASGSPSV